jgi:hypothetical protein
VSPSSSTIAAKNSASLRPPELSARAISWRTPSQDKPSQVGTTGGRQTLSVRSLTLEEADVAVTGGAEELVLPLLLGQCLHCWRRWSSESVENRNARAAAHTPTVGEEGKKGRRRSPWSQG